MPPPLPSSCLARGQGLPQARLHSPSGADAVVAWNASTQTALFLWQGTESRIDWVSGKRKQRFCVCLCAWAPELGSSDESHHHRHHVCVGQPSLPLACFLSGRLRTQSPSSQVGDVACAVWGAGGCAAARCITGAAPPSCAHPVQRAPPTRARTLTLHPKPLQTTFAPTTSASCCRPPRCTAAFSTRRASERGAASQCLPALACASPTTWHAPARSPRAPPLPPSAAAAAHLRVRVLQKAHRLHHMLQLVGEGARECWTPRHARTNHPLPFAAQPFPTAIVRAPPLAASTAALTPANSPRAAALPGPPCTLPTSPSRILPTASAISSLPPAPTLPTLPPTPSPPPTPSSSRPTLPPASPAPATPTQPPSPSPFAPLAAPLAPPACAAPSSIQGIASPGGRVHRALGGRPVRQCQRRHHFPL